MLGKAISRDCDSFWWVSPEHIEAYFAWRMDRIVATDGVLLETSSGCAALEYSPFDSGFFDLPMARVAWLSPASENSASKLIDQVLQSARKNGWCHLSIRVCSVRRGLVQILENKGFRTVDLQATLVYRFDDRADTTGGEQSEGLEINDVGRDDIFSIKALTRNAFRFSRFYADPALGHDKADKLHEKWVENNLNGRAEVNLAAHIYGEFVGFISCLFHERNEGLGIHAHGQIDLVAIKEAFRGKGIGKALVMVAIERFSPLCSLLAVGTQGFNLLGFRLYQACGFRLVCFETTLHRLVR